MSRCQTMNIRRFVSNSGLDSARSRRLAGAGDVSPGVNLSDRDDGWEQNYREPDVAVFLHDTKADQLRHALARGGRFPGRDHQSRRADPRKNPLLQQPRRGGTA